MGVSTIRHRTKIMNSNIKVTSTNQGDTVSSGVKLPGSTYTQRTGSAATKTGSKAFTRTTSHIGGLGGQSGSAREVKSKVDQKRVGLFGLAGNLSQKRKQRVGGMSGFNPIRGGYAPRRRGFSIGNEGATKNNSETLNKGINKAANFIGRVTKSIFA